LVLVARALPWPTSIVARKFAAYYFFAGKSSRTVTRWPHLQTLRCQTTAA
jgi:hypothetical protein